MDSGGKIKGALRNTLVIFIITIGLIGAFELCIRIFYPQNTRFTYLNDQSLGIEDAVLGHINRPNAVVRVKTPEFSTEYKINQEGLRDETLHINPKPPGILRILLIGDSFTFGDGNDYEKIWPVLLEKNIKKQNNNIDIVKAGIQGYDTRQELLYLERLWPKYTPDIVVIVFLPNGLFTNTSIDSPNAPDENVISIGRQKDEFRTLHSLLLIKRLMLKSDYSYFNIYRKTSRAQYYSLRIDGEIKKKIDITENLLLKANDYCNKHNAKLVVLSIPQLFQVIAKGDDYKAENIDVDNIDRIFLKFAKENGFYWITTLTELSQLHKEKKGDLYYRYDGHLNNVGNYEVGIIFTRKLGELLKEQLKISQSF